MPPKGATHFLGLQLAVDFLRAAIVDEQLEVIGAEVVEFDVDLPEFQTRNGVYAGPGDTYSASVDLWLKALDLLFERLQKRFDLTKIKAISGAAHLAPVWLTKDAAHAFQSLNSSRTLLDQIRNVIALPHTPVAQDSNAEPFGRQIETLLGGPEGMSARVGTVGHASLLCSQILYLKETKPEIYARVGRVQLASTFLSSVLTGDLSSITESDAASTGLYSLAQEQWDDGVLQIIAGGGNTDSLKGLLGPVVRPNTKQTGTLSQYFTTKYGFEADVSVFAFTSEHLATYLSMCPSSSDCVIDFGPNDILMTASLKAQTSPCYVSIPHPAQDAQDKRRYISVIINRNGDSLRKLVRDSYTKSWSAFDRLVAVVPPGGSIGLDDKLFSYWLLKDTGYPFTRVHGVYRFETGVKVSEFKDLRANPRCLLESQVLSLRIRLAHVIAAGIFLPSRVASKAPKATQSVNSHGIIFDPYETSNLPRRVLATGSASTFPSVVGLLGDVFNAPVFIPNSLVEASKPKEEGQQQQQPPPPSRPALGAAYVARWGWRKTNRDQNHASFEDEIRWLMTKKWKVGSSGPPTSGSGNRSRSVSAPGTAPGSYNLLAHAKSGLAASSFAEEEEDEESYESSFGQYSGAVTPPRARTNTASVDTSIGSLSGSGSSAQPMTSSNTSPNLAADSSLATNGTPGGVHPPMAPIQPLPTDDADIQLGLVKVAEADHDAFLTYAAVVPEYVRLERMLVKNLVI